MFRAVAVPTEAAISFLVHRTLRPQDCPALTPATEPNLLDPQRAHDPPTSRGPSVAAHLERGDHEELRSSGGQRPPCGLDATHTSEAVGKVEQDYLRRTVLREQDAVGGRNIELINVVVRYALDAGWSVILEGLLTAELYGDMLARLPSIWVMPAFGSRSAAARLKRRYRVTVCSITRTTSRSASPVASASVPPPWAMSGLPPPPPLSTFVAARTSSPAFRPRSRALSLTAATMTGLSLDKVVTATATAAGRPANRSLTSSTNLRSSSVRAGSDRC